jgi:hypothetical protein
MDRTKLRDGQWLVLYRAPRPIGSADAAAPDFAGAELCPEPARQPVDRVRLVGWLAALAFCVGAWAAVFKLTLWAIGR